MWVTVMGDAFIDMAVPVYGTRPGDTYHRKFSMGCGGTATVAVQAARLGAKARFVGKVGNDAFGSYFKENLKRNDVKDLTFIDNKHMTGLCVSLVYEDGERAMIASRGANDHLTKEEIKGRLDEILNSKIVYFTGYSLASRKSSHSVRYAMEECHRHNCEVWFNPGAPNMIKPSFQDIIKNLVNILVLNIEEAKALSGGKEISDILGALARLTGFAVITMGREGCIVLREGDQIQVPTNNTLKGLDTTGAGDAFSAGFIWGRLSNISERECAELGHRVAAKFLKERV